MDTCLRFRWRLSTLSSGFTTGKLILDSTTVTENQTHNACSNIDRLFALWQGLNPDKWFKESKVNQFFQETIGLPKDSPITPQTPLRPFHKDTKGTVITPEDVRYTYSYGYAYPELQTWKYKPSNYDNVEFAKQLRKTVNELYGVSRKAFLEAGSELKGVESSDLFTKALDFSFSIRFRKYAFGGEPFWVRLFLSMDGKNQSSCSDFITEVYNFSQSPEDGSGKLACSNCKSNQKKNITSTANISITPVLINLLKAGKDLASLAKDDVLKFLQKRVYWRVFKGNQEVPRYQLDALHLEIVGSTNDATHFVDPVKAPILENFKPEPTLTGGADGALDPSLKQPVTIPPPEKPKIPKGGLAINKSLPFKEELKPDSVVILESTSLNLNPAKTSGIDNTQFYFTDGKNGDGNILFLLSVRRAEKQIVFNTLIDNSWGKEVRVSLDRRFLSDKPSILVHDQGDGYEVFIDWKHVLWFEKRAAGKVARSVKYTVNDGQASVWSPSLKVRVYPSMKDVFNH